MSVDVVVCRVIGCDVAAFGCTVSLHIEEYFFSFFDIHFGLISSEYGWSEC